VAADGKVTKKASEGKNSAAETESIEHSMKVGYREWFNKCREDAECARISHTIPTKAAGVVSTIRDVNGL